MKFAIILILALTLLLSACTTVPVESTTTQTPPVTTTASDPELPKLLIDVSEFSGWLDGEKLLPHLAQEDFCKLLDNYSLGGTSVQDLAEITEYCSSPGSHFSANGDKFSFVYQVDVRSDWTYQTNQIKMNTFLEGMDNPFGLDFERSLPEVMGKFFENFDPNTDFVPDKDNRWEMTLYEGLADRIFLTRSGSSYTLTYTQAKAYQYSQTRLINVDRSVVLVFQGADQRLEEIQLEMVESWPNNN